MTTKKELERRLKSVATVGKLALRAWRAGVENQWYASGGYTATLIRLGELADGRKLPKDFIKNMRDRLTKELVSKRGVT